jgi:hypothetical protein
MFKVWTAVTSDESLFSCVLVSPLNSTSFNHKERFPKWRVGNPDSHKDSMLSHHHTQVVYGHFFLDTSGQKWLSIFLKRGQAKRL